jgi:predicted SnoaL-like aldol condensation-catalyzing enzyme
MKLTVVACVLAIIIGIDAAAPYCPPRPATETEQKAIFEEFIHKIYGLHNASLALNDHGDPEWIEHDPGALSGRQNVIDILTGLLPMTNQTFIHRGLVDGVGFTHFREDVPDQPPFVVVDFFRFNGTCIMEHWDVSQTRDPNSLNPIALW